MSLFKGLIKRPVCVLMFVIMALVFGGISTINMEQALLPEISMPNIIVMTSYSGAGPEEVEKLVTVPIENAVSSVPDFVNVTSTSSYGSSMVMIEVASDADATAELLACGLRSLSVSGSVVGRIKRSIAKLI